MSICSLIVSGLFPSALAEMKVNAAPLPSLPSLPCTPDAPCSDLQGMLSGLLPDTQISTSSSREMVWNPGTARLVASRSGWFPGPAQPLAGEEWLQVLDMKIEHLFVSFFFLAQLFQQSFSHSHCLYVQQVMALNGLMYKL